MHNVVIGLPQDSSFDAWMTERSRLGLDRRDEVWDGVLHMSPQPSMHHQRLASRLIEALAPLARARGLEIITEPSMFEPERGDKNYRVPDVVAVDPARTSDRGIEGGAELVIEILSPNDESRAKFPFYATRGVREIWLIEPLARTVELYELRGGAYVALGAAPDGAVNAPLLGLALTTIAGEPPTLRLAWVGGAVEI